MIGLVPLYVRRVGSLDRELVGFSFVDFEDLARVNEYRWRGSRDRDDYAARRDTNMPLHRFVLQLLSGDGFVHHVNELKRDNRKANLVVCASRSEANSLPHPRRDARGREGMARYLAQVAA